MAEFKFTSISITKISNEDNLFQIIFDNNSQSYLLDYTAHVNKNDLTIYDNVINKQYVFNYTAVKVRSNEIDEYSSFTTSKEMFLYLFNLGFFNKRCCTNTNSTSNNFLNKEIILYSKIENVLGINTLMYTNVLKNTIDSNLIISSTYDNDNQKIIIELSIPNLIQNEKTFSEINNANPDMPITPGKIFSDNGISFNTTSSENYIKISTFI